MKIVNSLGIDIIVELGNEKSNHPPYSVYIFAGESSDEEDTDFIKIRSVKK